MPAAITQRELEALYDPLRYEQGPPLETLAALREQSAVVWVEEHELPLWPGGAGFWLVLRHAECMQVLRNARLFSSQIGATQLRDPATAEDLAYVQQMMLNMDPPEHTRLRRLLINAFTSKAVANLDRQMARAGRENKIAVVVGTITDDDRRYNMKKGLTVSL